MPSPDSRRSAAELLLRGVSLAAMITLAMRLWTGATAPTNQVSVGSASLDSALSAWTEVPTERARLTATSVPDARQRHWLRALRRTGLDFAWTIADSTGSALVVERGPLAHGPSRVTALGSAGAAFILADELGRIDSTVAGPDGVATWRFQPLAAVNLVASVSRSMAAARDSLVTQPVLVIGHAGWESKFVTAALEEDGWTVATRIIVAPGAIVRQGAAAIDTSALSAVIVLDSTSALDGSALRRFVNEGGGLVASGSGARHPALRGLVPRSTAAMSGEVGALLGPTPREGLNARTFMVSANAVAVERRGNATVVAGRRVGSGRVLVAGYDDTWRTRMATPDETAPDAHRAWWSSLVASVALARPVLRALNVVDEAPFAATVDALGPPVASGDSPARGPAVPWEVLLAAIAALALLAEWLSRRLRGVA